MLNTTSISHQGNMRWRIALALALAAAGNLAVIAEELPVRGSKVRWTASLASGWVGGSARQIENVLAGTTNDTLRAVMSEMLLDAKGLDVFFTHVDITGATSRTVSSLRVNTLKLDMALADKEERNALWRAFTPRVQKDYPPGSTTTLGGDAVTTTGGRPAYQAMYRTEMPNGSAVYVLVHFVDLPDGTVHMFMLKADSNKMPAREKEVRQFLDSVRYN